MGGDVEDCVGIQTEQPTSSISFGRFEAESLSWERRSSFNHNRYLEEVEKYSTPGSVTQKKAYFEEQFKKKGLFHQAPSVSHDQRENQSREHRNEYHNEHTNEYYDHSKEGIQCEEFQNHSNDGVEFSWYDETPIVSDDLEHEVTDGEGEVSSNSQTPAQHVFNIEETAATQFHEAESIKAVQTQEMLDTCENSDKSLTLPGDVTMNAKLGEESDVKRDVLERVSDETGSALMKKAPKSSVKGMAKPSTGQKKTRSTSKIPSTSRTLPRLSAEKKYIGADRLPVKTPKKLEPVVPAKIKTEKVPHMRTSTTPSSKSKTVRHQVSQNMEGEKRLDYRSDPNRNKVAKVINRSANCVIPQSISQRSESTVRESTTRSKRVANSSKQDSKVSGTVFNFKSDERAEKRKEFFTKLEEKLHAKEAQMNKIQAKTQEETEAQMRQFRMSLNFKATPMPAFYHEALPRASNGKKPITASGKSRKEDVNLSSPASFAENGNLASLSNSTTPPVSRYPERLSTSQQDNFAIEEKGGCSSAILSEPVNTEGTKEAKQESDSHSKTVVGKKSSNVSLQGKLGQSKLKKEEKVGKASSSSSTKKVMKGMVRGPVAVHVAS